MSVRFPLDEATQRLYQRVTDRWLAGEDWSCYRAASLCLSISVGLAIATVTLLVLSAPSSSAVIALMMGWLALVSFRAGRMQRLARAGELGRRRGGGSTIAPQPIRLDLHWGCFMAAAFLPSHLLPPIEPAAFLRDLVFVTFFVLSGSGGYLLSCAPAPPRRRRAWRARLQHAAG